MVVLNNVYMHLKLKTQVDPTVSIAFYIHEKQIKFETLCNRNNGDNLMLNNEYIF